MPYALEAALRSSDDVEGDIFMRCPTTGNRFPPPSTPGPWCLLHIEKSKRVCTVPLVRKITGGIAPRPEALKAPDRIETAVLSCRWTIKRPARVGGAATFAALTSIFPADFRRGFLSFGCRFFCRDP
jgi:hypothetical protein